MPSLGSLTTGELSTTSTAARWLLKLNANNPGILDSIVVAKISTLVADCHAEWEDRKRSEEEHRRQAVAQHRDPLEHYSA